VIALELIEKSSQLGSRFCRCDKQFLPLLVQMRAHEFALEVFRELGEPHLSVAVKAQVFQRSGAILAELARNDPAIFVQVCLEESVMSAMVDVLDRVKVDDVFANTITQMEQLQSVLKFLQAFLDNKFDKALVCKR
jgi:small basic protein